MTWAMLGTLPVRDLRSRYPEQGGTYPRRALPSIDEYIQHHVGAGEAPTGEAAALAAIDGIDRYHREHNGWPCIAYALVIDGAGTVWWTNGLEVAGYCHGTHNGRGVGVVWLGDWTYRAPPEVMLRAAYDLWQALQQHLAGMLTLLGHQDVMQTSCPGEHWPETKLRLLTMSDTIDPEAVRDPLNQLWAKAQIMRRQAVDLERMAGEVETHVVQIKQAVGLE